MLLGMAEKWLKLADWADRDAAWEADYRDVKLRKAGGVREGFPRRDLSH
jgi:hypothetical protein